jgi:unsaturated rhamnogalacturonyl hydrolase
MHYIKRTFLFLLTILPFFSTAQTKNNYAEQMANTIMHIWNDTLATNHQPARWSYDQSVVLQGIYGLWNATGDGKYFRYIKNSMDFFLDEKGNIHTYDYDKFTLDNIVPGRILLYLYRITGDKKYYTAVQTLREQLRNQPRTNTQGFWHKKIYPNQIWLDGLYMAEPFYTEYANTFHKDSDYNDIARQFIEMEKHARDTKTGLLYHGYDASKKEKWANKETGVSPNFWGQAMGWYGMGLVDVLENFSDNHPQKKELISILNRYATAIKNVQDSQTGLWWDVLNMPGKEKNYFEASASCMFVYTLAKGVRLGYLPSSFLDAAKKGYNGILEKFIKKDNNGQLNLYGTVKVSGLGGNPYRDGSYNYYTGEDVIENDPKGIGAFLLAANEMEMLPTLSSAKDKTVLLDCYFNHETKKDVTGKIVQWHYVWNEFDNGGFSMFGNAFKKFGFQLKEITEAPTVNNLKNASVYIIVDPDTEKESDHPNYIQDNNVDEIFNWVKNGGTLLLFGNDSGNVEFTHFNKLAAKFGITFNGDSKNHDTATDFEMAAVDITNNNAIFKNEKKVFVKEYSSLSIKSPAVSVLDHNNDHVAAIAKIGKGAVFVVGDPWFYNEYEDGRKLSSDFENYNASVDLVKWIIHQSMQ